MGRPHRDRRGGVARTEPPRALLPARRRLGPARALESARVLHASLRPGLRRAGDGDVLRRLARSRFDGRRRTSEPRDLRGRGDDGGPLARPARGEARPPRDRRQNGARVRLGPRLLLRRARVPREVGLGCRARHAELVAALPRDRRGPAVRSRARRRAATHACAHDARRRAGNDSRPRRRRRAARARGSLVRARPPRGDGRAPRARRERLAARVPEGAHHDRGRLVAAAHRARSADHHHGPGHVTRRRRRRGRHRAL